MVATITNLNRTGNVEEFAADAALELKTLWQQRFGSALSESEVEELTTAIWECIWHTSR